MSCVRIPGGLMTVADIYRYGGFTFEWHYFCGPMLLRKDGEPSNAEEQELMDYLTFIRVRNRRALAADTNRAGGKPSFVGQRVT